MTSRRPTLQAAMLAGFGTLAAVLFVAAAWPVAATKPGPAKPGPSPVPRPVASMDEIRVGLATDLDRLDVPCCKSPSWLVSESGERHETSDGFSVRPAPGKASPGMHRLQVAALRDRRQARQLADRLAALLDQEADAVLDAASGLYRVRVGRYAARDQAETARGRLRVEGFDDVWIVVEGAMLEDPGFHVEGIGRIAGRRLRFESADGVARFRGRRYRGALELFLNDRVGLNVVNAAPLEDYLRAVVPVELGPDLYPEFEATKAQSVAARTYAARHRGEFDDEGYDICATALCQVYGGMEVEHPRSDAAVQATRGEILMRGGEAIEALFTASCGGRTELADTVFPRLAGDGPTGAECVEGGVVPLHGEAAGRPEDHLLDALGLADVPESPRGERLNHARSTGALELVAGNLGRLDDGWLQIHSQGARRLTPLASGGGLLTAQAPAGSSATDLGVPVAALAMAPGDRVRAWIVDRRAVLVVHETPARVGQPVSTPWSVWRSRRWLQDAVERRFPGLELDSLRVLERGTSGRVARLDLIGDRRSVEVQGLAIRWLLGVPENLVRMTAEADRNGDPGWRFEGKGRGHGVGMCQVGAYLMAQRGLSYREILWHYYGAVEIGSAGS